MLETIDHIRGNYSIIIEDIENDIYYDIEDLRKNKNRLYNRDGFRQNGQYIDIISPVHIHPDVKNSIKADSFRHLLSLYPEKEDLTKVRSIIIRPRYVEINGAELISLFVRRERIIVIYLHQPYSYPVSNLKFSSFPEKLYSCMFGLAQKGLQYNNRNEKASILKIPVLWYILSTISCTYDDNIEKFVIKRNDRSYHDNIRKLTEISFYYSRLGY